MNETLAVGDFIGFGKSEENILWLEIKAITEKDGERAYKIAYSDGELIKMPVRASLVRFVKKSERAEIAN